MWPLRRRVMLMVGRAVLTLIDDGPKMQVMQVQGLKGEILDRIERFQNYGLTSVPHEDAEVLIVCPGGIRQHAIAIAVDDRRYRVIGLERGEVCLYTDEDEETGEQGKPVDGPQHRIHLKRGRAIDMWAGASGIVMTPDGVDIRGPALTHNGVNVGDDHTHGGVTAGGASTAGPQ